MIRNLKLNMKHKSYNLSMARLVLVWLVALVQFVMPRCVLSLTNTIVLNSANYEFRYTPSNIAASKAQIAAMKFTFPLDSGIVVGSLTCTALDATAFLSSTPTCTSGFDSSGNPYIIVDNVRPSQFTYQLTIAGVTNANAAKQVTPIHCNACSSAANCANDVLLFTNDQIRQTYSAKTVIGQTSTSVSLPRTNGDTASTATIQMILTDPVTAKGTVKIRMPKSNQKFLTLGSQISQSLILDAEMGGLFTVKAKIGAIGSTVITDIPLLTPPEVQIDIIQDYDDLLISLANTAELPKNQILYIEINPCRNPPSLNPITGFEFYTGDENFNVINQQVADISLETSAPGAFLSSTLFPSSAEIMGGNTKVALTNVDYKFTLYTTNDIPRKAKVYLTFPSDWVLNTAAFPLPTVSCQLGCNFLTAAIQYEGATNTLQLLQGFEDANSYQYNPGPIIFTLSGMTNPSTTKMQTFTMTTYNMDGNIYKIDEATSLFTLTFTTGVITIQEITPTDTEIMSTTGTYKVGFSCEHDILTTYKLTMKMASGLEVQQKSGCTAIGNLIGASYSCNADAANNEIVLSTFVDATVPAGTLMTFTVDAITNPGNFEDTGSAAFTMTFGDGKIDEGTYTMASNLFTPSTITSMSIYAHDRTAAFFPVKYSFTLTPKARVAKGSYIIITLPPQVEPYDSTRLARACPYSPLGGFSNTQISCQYLSNTNQIKITSGLAFRDSVSNPPTFTWDFEYLKNPRGLVTSGFFNATIYTEKDQELFIFNKNVSANVTMNQLPTPLSIEYERTSLVNGIPINLTMIVKATNYLESDDNIELLLPRPFGYTDATECYGTSFWLSGFLNCNKSGDLQTVIANVSVAGRYITRYNRRLEDTLDLHEPRGRELITYKIPAGDSYSLTLTNISVPGSMRPSVGTIQFTMKTYQGEKLEYQLTDLNLQNTIAGTINPKTASVIPNYWEKGKLANYTIKFVPENFEQNMKIVIGLDKRVVIPDNWNNTCKGIRGTDKVDLACEVNWYNHTITLTDAVASKDIKPDVIEFVIENLTNPIYNIVTESFTIHTYTYDWYAIDKIERDLTLNFYCIFPCATCNFDYPDKCYSCYLPASTTFNYLWQEQCLDDCPAGMHEDFKNVTVEADPIFTCSYCQSPCYTCGDNATDCSTCIEGWLLYEVDNTCYEAINWYFPFIIAMIFFSIISWIADCCDRSTDIMHSMMYFLGFLEVGLIFVLLYMGSIGKVSGDRSLALVSFAMFFLLNLIFMVIHQKSIIEGSSLEYKQVQKDFKYTFLCCNCLSYCCNFKMSLILISQFYGRPRFGGTFNNDSWQKFNTFAVLYIILVYIPFVADFYAYFLTFGLRTIVSYIAGEMVVIMTIIALMLFLNIINSCSCAGMRAQDLGKRANLFDGIGGDGKKKKGKGKRKAFRSGMGNDEDDYGSSDDSDESDDYVPAPRRRAQYEMSEPSEDDDEKLKEMARKMKLEREAMEEEKRRLLAEEQLKLQSNSQWQEETQSIRQELVSLKKQKEEIMTDVDTIINQKLGGWDGNPRKTPLGEWMEYLPNPVTSTPVEINVELNGDEEYWMQLSARYGGASDISGGGRREMDATTMEYFDGLSASRSANIDQPRKSVGGTEREYFDNVSAMQSNIDIARSQNTIGGIGTQGERFGTEIEHVQERRSADFGDVSQGMYDKSQAEICPKVDLEGHSDESSEGIVANHDPFKGVQEAAETQARRAPPDSDQDASPEEDNRPSGRARKVKQVLYSDKSESSVDDMMEDTPSNYNIANGRLEGKSMGLKAILLYAKNQGINLGNQANPASLAQINEEGRNSEAEGGGGWNNMSMPINGQVSQVNQVGSTTMNQQQTVSGGQHTTVITRTVHHTIEQDRSGMQMQEQEMTRQRKQPTKRNPGTQKQFLEPSDKGGDTPLKKNNFM